MTQDLNPIQKPQPVYVIVQQSIRDYIFDNNLKSGDSLPSEGDLAKQLGVSRNAVREAIKALEAVGFVESRRGSGIYVGKFSLEPIIVNLPYSLLSDLKQLSDLLEIRQTLEIGMIERVISQLNQSQAEELKAIVEKMYQEGEKGNAFPNIDRQFHVVLLSNVGNSTLIQILDIFWLTFRKASNTLNLENTSPLATAKHHDEILQACLDSDPERVKQALIEHYRDIEERLNNLNWNTSNVE